MNKIRKVIVKEMTDKVKRDYNDSLTLLECIIVYMVLLFAVALTLLITLFLMGII